MKQKIKKAGHIAFHLMQSISTKVVLIILILVLPLNILAIVLSHAAIDNSHDRTGGLIGNQRYGKL